MANKLYEESNIQAIADAIRAKGQTGTMTVAEMPERIANIPQPSGNINITTMNSTDVTNYATAQVVDADLVASNIKKDVNILGVTGTYEGGATVKVVLMNNGTILNCIRYGEDEYMTAGDVINVVNGDLIIMSGANTVYVDGEYIETYGYRPTTDCTIRFNNQLKNVYIATTGYNYLQDKTVTSNGTYTADESYDGLGTVTVNVSGTPTECIVFDYSGTTLQKATVYSTKTSPKFILRDLTTITELDLSHCVGMAVLPQYLAQGCTALTTVALPSTVYAYSTDCFRQTAITEYPLTATTYYIYSRAFYQCRHTTTVTFPSAVRQVDVYSFYGNTGLTTVTFQGTPSLTVSASAFTDCTNITDIYVPWAEGAKTGAPWGATNATVHYNS